MLTKTPKRRPRQTMLFEKEEPVDSLQVDVKAVKPARENDDVHDIRVINGR